MSASNPFKAQQPIFTDGILSINKDAGWTSHDVVARVRRLLHIKRVGHAGTLDPAATGVLPVCVGQATRMVEYLSDSGKAYRATIHFGINTTTYDAEGEVTSQCEVPHDLDQSTIASILPQFIGTIQQRPPIYSALKRDGKKLYELARAGIAIEIEPRPIFIASITIVKWESPLLTIAVECGKGTYIRSLAYDMGQVLGIGGHLSALERTRVATFTTKNSISIADLEVAIETNSWQPKVYAVDEAVLHLPAIIVNTLNEQRIRQGLPLQLQPKSQTPLPLLRSYSTDGRFIALLEQSSPSQWHPAKVFTVDNLNIESDLDSFTVVSVGDNANIDSPSVASEVSKEL